LLGRLGLEPIAHTIEHICNHIEQIRHLRRMAGDRSDSLLLALLVARTTWSATRRSVTVDGEWRP
jgi:hypothetical protein